MIISDEYIYPKLRAEGGAYNVGVRQGNQHGSMQFFSSRTSNVQRDLTQMLASIRWFLDVYCAPSLANFPVPQVKQNAEPIFNVPATPMQLFVEGFIEGEADTLREVPTRSDLHAIAIKYLHDKEYNCVVVAGAPNAVLARDFGLDIRSYHSL